MLEQRVALLEIKERAEGAAASSIGEQEAQDSLVAENRLRETI